MDTRPTDAVLFPDAEQLACEALLGSPLLAGVAIESDIPDDRPLEFIRVERVGGPQETVSTEAPLLAIEGWAQTKYRASQLLRYALAVLRRQQGAVFGYREIGGPGSLPDPLSHQYRYTATVQLRTRGINVTI